MADNLTDDDGDLRVVDSDEFTVQTAHNENTTNGVAYMAAILS